MYGVNNVNHSPFSYGKKGQPPVQPEQQKPVDEKNTGRKDEILFSSVSRKDESYLSSLSKEAKDYLSKLKEMYPDYDFIIADYSTDEDASRLLSQGKGEINVLITPDLLEKMATDEATRAKYEDIINGAAAQFDEINANLSVGGKELIKSLGITVNEDGTVNFFANLIGGVTSEDGSKVIKSSLVSEFTEMLNAMAEARAKQLEKKEEDPPPHAGKKDEKESTMPPKSFEKYKKEENFYDRKKEPGNLPPESFEKYRKEKSPYDTKEDHGKLPSESFKKHRDEDMNFKV